MTELRICGIFCNLLTQSYLLAVDQRTAPLISAAYVYLAYLEFGVVLSLRSTVFRFFDHFACAAVVAVKF